MFSVLGHPSMNGNGNFEVGATFINEDGIITDELVVKTIRGNTALDGNLTVAGGAVLNGLTTINPGAPQAHPDTVS
jgi:hypothetical protein